MPFVNLGVAQAAAAWIAAPNLVSLLVQNGPAYAYIVAAVSAVIVLVGAYIGSRLSGLIAAPSLQSLVISVALALIAAWAAATFIAPMAEEQQSELLTQLVTFLPVAAAMAGYFIASARTSA